MNRNKPALTRAVIQEILTDYQAKNYPRIIAKQTRIIFKQHRIIACLEKKLEQAS